MTMHRQLNAQRIIGLTGGIGMGKSTVSNYLAETYNVPILDADVYARHAVDPGSHLLEEIVDRYGLGMLLPDGKLDRRRMGNIIFNSPPERQWLEQRIHPFVRDRMETRLQALQSDPVVMLVVPLLFEARMTDLVREVWVIACSERQQIDRLVQRDRLTIEQAKARMKSQMSIERKIQQADIVLDNSTTVDELLRQVDSAMSANPLLSKLHR